MTDQDIFTSPPVQAQAGGRSLLEATRKALDDNFTRWVVSGMKNDAAALAGLANDPYYTLLRIFMMFTYHNTDTPLSLGFSVQDPLWVRIRPLLSAVREHVFREHEDASTARVPDASVAQAARLSNALSRAPVSTENF